MQKKTKTLIILGIAAALVIGAAVLLGVNKHYYFWIAQPLYSQSKERQYKEEAASAVKGEVVFLGDSITDFCDLKRFYPSFTAYNRGISGDSTRMLKKRLQSVYDLEPAVVVLLIGVNDFMNESRTVEDTAADYDFILSELRRHLPESKIICQSVYPGDDSASFKLVKWQQSVRQLNEIIKGFCDEYGLTYADVYPSLLNPDTGLIDRRFTDDGCHPNDTGYAQIAKVLTPILQSVYDSAKG